MRLFVHDFGGYAFPFQLSQELAGRGHFVHHAYCADLITTPLGIPDDDDGPMNLSVAPLSLGVPLQKYNFFARWRQERAYGRLVADEALAFGPDAVLSANTPLDTQRRLLAACRSADVPFVFWIQDLLGLAAHRLLRDRLPLFGDTIGRHYIRLERRLLRKSQAVIAISAAFQPLLRNWGVEDSRVHLIENWAPLDALPRSSKDNPWARRHGLQHTFNFVYAGTLGMKHNPERLLDLARRFAGESDTRVVVLSQALGAAWLREAAERESLATLVVLPYQSVADLPEVLGTADVLVALLEPDAGEYSAPSKVLTYLCAGRPLLLAMPPENTSASMVIAQDAGLVVSPADREGFLDAATRLRSDAELRNAQGTRARSYAERTFDIVAIADRFDAVLEHVAGAGRATGA
jgi:glycosyltransferase involved in cell wall biosynthesis